MESKEQGGLSVPKMEDSLMVSKKGLGYRFAKEDMYKFTNITGSLSQYYDLSQVLGEGSFGKIFKGLKKGQENKNPVAIKQIDKKRLQKFSDTAEEDLKMEVTVQNILIHPNIVKIHECYQNKNYFWIVQDFCEGGELFDCIIEHQKYSEGVAKKTFKNILQSVNQMHVNGFCHRDLKPENVLLLDSTDMASTMLIDFGFAAKFADKQTGEKIRFSECVGTPSYQSIEVLNGDYDEKCDSFALGIILYILLAGGHPFQGRTDQITEQKVRNNQYSFKYKVFDQISKEGKDLITQFLKPEKERINVADALKHPWFDQKEEDVHLDLDAFKQFVYSSKFKKLVIYRLCSTIDEKLVKQLGEIFKQIDKDNNGTINLQEFQKVVQEKLTEEEKVEINKIFDRLDPDDNQQIDYNEFIASMIDKSVYLKKENLVDCFKMFDKNGDGKITKDEIKAELEKNNYFQGKGEKYYDQLLKEADKDGNGFIDFEEFKAMMEKTDQ